MDNFNVLFAYTLTRALKLPFNQIFNILYRVKIAIFLVLHLQVKIFTYISLSLTWSIIAFLYFHIVKCNGVIFSVIFLLFYSTSTWFSIVQREEASCTTIVDYLFGSIVRTFYMYLFTGNIINIYVIEFV